MKLIGNWNYPTSIKFGAGRIKELGCSRKVRPASSGPLLVTDPLLAKLPITANALAILEADGVPARVFSDIKPNPIAVEHHGGPRRAEGRQS